MINVGLIGLDMSQALSFTQLLNDPAHPYALAGARVTVGYAGGSDDFELSRSRVGEITQTVRDKHGVRIVDSPQAVAEAADLVLITAVDGRVHRAFVEQIAPLGKPIFVGKPMALSTDDAVAMFEIADQYNVSLSSCSAARFSDAVTTAIGDGKGILGCDVFGPTSQQPTQPGFFWYGIHGIEMAVAVMGVGCVEVHVTTAATGDVTTLRYGDGRVATVRGIARASYTYGLTVHRAGDSTYADTTQSDRSMVVNLLSEVLRTMPKGLATVPREQTLEIIRIVEAANVSQQKKRAISL